MASLHKDPLQRSPYFYCKFRNADGKVSFKSTKKKKSEDAWHVCLAKGTWVRYRGVLENFLDFVEAKKANANIASVTAGDIEAFRDSGVASGKSQSTANFSLKTIKGVFQAARRQGLILQNPGDAVDAFAAEKEERDVFTDDQIRSLLRASVGSDWEGMILVGRNTGAKHHGNPQRPEVKNFTKIEQNLNENLEWLVQQGIIGEQRALTLIVRMGVDAAWFVEGRRHAEDRR